MKLKVWRRAFRSNYTIGKLYVDGNAFCDTLEDTNRDLNKNGKFDNGESKVYGETCIPFGRYIVKLTYSPKFAQKAAYKSVLRKGALPLICDVPNFDGVRIHAGSSSKDTAGCLLVGKNTVVGHLTESMETFKNLYQALLDASDRGETITIDFV